MRSSWPDTGRPKTPEWELQAFKKAAWRDGVACFRIEDIKNPYDRQVVINLANEMYGRRG